MIIKKTQENDMILLALEGRLDTTTAPQLQDVLLPALGGTQEVTLDFSRIDYVSSAGLRVLLMGQKAAKKNGCSLTIRRVSEEIMEVFEMTGFSEILTVV